MEQARRGREANAVIKATIEVENGKLLLLGLSRFNCERLLAGKPIPIDCKELGLPPLEIVLFGGEDEAAMAAELQRNGMQFPSDPDKMHIDPRIFEA